MKVMKWIVISIVVLCVGAVAIGFMLPSSGHVERSATFNARPATVYTVLNGFRLFDKWSPWKDYDPAAKTTIEGPVLGVGARQSWHSEDPGVGSGGQEIVENKPYEMIRIKLSFEGYDAPAFAVYRIEPAGEGTKLTWTYDSDFGGNIMYRYFGLMLERMLGPDYEKGLGRLKTLVEALPRDDFTALPLELVRTKAVPIVYASGESGVDQVSGVLGALYGKLIEFITGYGLKQSDAVIAVTRDFDVESKFWKFDAAIPVDRADVTLPADGDVKLGSTYAGLAIKAVHQGPYSDMEKTYNQLLAYKAAAGLEDNGNSWEHYVSDPATVPEAALLTHIYWPAK